MCGVVCVLELLFKVVCLLQRECVFCFCALLCGAVWCVCLCSSCLYVRAV